MTAIMLFSLLAVTLSVLVAVAGRRVQARWQAWPLLVVGILGFIASATMTVWSIAATSGDRSPQALDFGATLTYERVAIDEPHQQVLHVAVVDLDNPCVELTTSRPGRGGLIDAETGTEFVARTGVALAINVAFFYPFDEYPYWDSYPDSGEPVTAIGPVVIDGNWLGNVDGGGDNGLAVRAGQLSAGTVASDADFSVPGNTVLVSDGTVVAPDSKAYPRTVAGVDLDTNQLVLVVSDGKQPGYADGSTYRAIAEFLVERGVDEAVEFDGGGSATMAATVDGQVELLSRPSHQRIPGRQRPVATHLGITIDADCVSLEES